MSEFKISRIRYTWLGEWNSGTTYNRDAVVSYGGASWVCIRQHSSTEFATDQIVLINPNDTTVSPAWIKMTDGYKYRNEWLPSILYNPGDIVLNGGNLYLCVTSYTAGSTFDSGIDNWVIYSSSLALKQVWEENIRYSINDIVRYNGIVYRCIEEHTAANTENGLEQDQEKWQIFYEGVEYRGEWEIDTIYRVNDLVKYGGTVFRCKKGHTPNSILNFDQEENWEIEFPGFQYSSEWDPTQVYQVGDLVKHGGWLYYSLTTNYASNPVDSIYQLSNRADPIDWQIAAKGINFRGEWSAVEIYKTGDVVRRGGNIYTALLDTTDDGSSLDYLDSTNWELLTVGQNWKNSWQSDQRYAPNDLVIYLGSAYQCNLEHESSDQNYPGDNGSGFFYWDLVLQAGTESGLSARGDLLTFDLTRQLAGDGSTFGPAAVGLGAAGQLLSINNNDSIIYKNFGETHRVVYVDLSGVDDDIDPRGGVSPFKQWRTIRYACERLDDGFSGTTTINVGAGQYDEVLPISIPARTVVLGSELRTTTVNASGPVKNLSLDSESTLAVLNRLSTLLSTLITGASLVPIKTASNLENPVVLTENITTNIPFDPPRVDDTGNEVFDVLVEEVPLAVDPQSITDIQNLVIDIRSYINAFINNIGSIPTLVGNNTARTSSGYTNTVLILEANKRFLVAEAVAFIQTTFPSYQFDTALCGQDIRRYINAWKYDIIYPGNYKSLEAARYYKNAVLGSTTENMFFCRDTTGVRNCTVQGLNGTLNPPGINDIFRLPTGGAYISLDPGWGPADNRTWIINRSPYIQGVTTLGYGCVGQKIDGALHAGGNKSITSNDFTQVISDGVGAWVTNNGRAELVSVFSYYAHVGYLTQAGGIIRATNGNNSYGRFGAIADGVDPTETPITAAVYTRAQQAIIASTFAGDFVDEIQIIEWANAGQDYTTATASFIGAGINAEVLFEDFRDDAVFEARQWTRAES